MPQDEKAAWVERVLGVGLGVAGTGAKDAPDVARALAEWQVARAKVVGQLAELSGAIEDADDPEGFQAIVLLQAIIKNLTPAPATRQQVQELERYLSTDAIIEEAESPNGFGLSIAIREPLLPLLGTLKEVTEA